MKFRQKSSNFLVFFKMDLWSYISIGIKISIYNIINLMICIFSFKNYLMKGEAWLGGGVLFEPDEVHESLYSWGLEEDTNNIVEYLSLWKGLFQFHAHGISEIIVIGDSRLIIQAMVTKSLPTQMKLWQIINFF